MLIWNFTIAFAIKEKETWCFTWLMIVKCILSKSFSNHAFWKVLVGLSLIRRWQMFRSYNTWCLHITFLFLQNQCKSLRHKFQLHWFWNTIDFSKFYLICHWDHLMYDVNYKLFSPACLAVRLSHCETWLSIELLLTKKFRPFCRYSKFLITIWIVLRIFIL